MSPILSGRLALCPVRQSKASLRSNSADKIVPYLPTRSSFVVPCQFCFLILQEYASEARGAQLARLRESCLRHLTGVTGEVSGELPSDEFYSGANGTSVRSTDYWGIRRATHPPTPQPLARNSRTPEMRTSPGFLFHFQIDVTTNC